MLRWHRGIRARMRREDQCPELVPLLRMMSRRPPAIITALASSGRGRALTRRMADYFGLFYPHEFTSAASLLIVLILLRSMRTAACCCNHALTGSILHSRLSLRHLPK